MSESLDRSFGLTIAFLLPGFSCLCGFSYFSPTLAMWMSTQPTREPGVSGFLYVVLGSLAAGLIVSAVRWAVIDTIHHATGLARPDFNYAQLSQHLLAFQLAVEHNYRYFQFYANMAIAVLVFAACDEWSNGRWTFLDWMALLGLEAILFAASRDALGRYYSRVGLLLGTRDELDS